MRANETHNQTLTSGATRLRNTSPVVPPEWTVIPSTPEQPSKKANEKLLDPQSGENSRGPTSKPHKRIEVDPELARSPNTGLGCEEEPTSRSIPVAASGDPEALYPHLHVLLRLRKMAFAEAYTRKETRQILGVSEKTLQRWIDQGRLEIYGLPDVCASAADIEKCLNDCRSRTKKHY